VAAVRNRFGDMEKKIDLVLGSIKSFFDWQQEKGSIQTIKNFALWLDIPPATVSQWLNNARYPSEIFRYNFIAKFGNEALDTQDRRH
jgi:hypothetical protein